jgi:phage I-like protein
MTSSIATLAQTLTTASKEIRILPPGVFRAWDGRPPGLAGWMIDATIAARIVADLAARDDLVIDYEHQTVLAKQNGQPAPAAGWINSVVWREGQGLFAVGVKWTAKAMQMLAAGEYRYISPVFTFSKENGQVERLLSLGLTNNPGLNGLTDLTQLAANLPQPDDAPQESDRGIEAFNRTFGEVGIFHPQTPATTLAELTGTAPKPPIPATMSDRDAAVLRHFYPDTFA